MRTLALALLSCGLLSLPVAASAAPHRVAGKKAAATRPAKQHAKMKAAPRHGKAPAQHARYQSNGRSVSRAQHS
jgi:hypothetical protein